MTLQDVIQRLRYKADNIKAKLEPNYFSECADYLEKYRWHNLEEDPTDLPIDMNGADVLVRTKYGYFACTYCRNLKEFDSIAFEGYGGGGFVMPDSEWGYAKLANVHRWKYIEPFEVDTWESTKKS